MDAFATTLLDFMQADNVRFMIPVFQRRYSWGKTNCKQLMDDLLVLINNQRARHYFGSMVSAVFRDGELEERSIIDGQQRLTTVTLLLLAIVRLVREDSVGHTSIDNLDGLIEKFLYNTLPTDNSRLKLRLIQSDQRELEELVEGDASYLSSSDIKRNYLYFYDRIQEENIGVVGLLSAICKLEVISLTLGSDDDAQQIFESINSTGMPLEEADKIRNYILMGIAPAEQERLHNDFWLKLEGKTQRGLSDFIRHYLSIKVANIPRKSETFQAFRSYTQSNDLKGESLLSDMLMYAELYEKLINCKSGLAPSETQQKLDYCLLRFKRLGYTVSIPFTLEVLRLIQSNEISAEEALQSLELIESFLFRRMLCGYPTHALKKIFLSLNREVHSIDYTYQNYTTKLSTVLLKKSGGNKFPEDEEYLKALFRLCFYELSRKIRAYIFDRLENKYYSEYTDIYTQIMEGSLAFVPILPSFQYITQEWREELGYDAQQTIEYYYDKVSNYTLIPYDRRRQISENDSFSTKRTIFLESGLKINRQFEEIQHLSKDVIKDRLLESIADSMFLWCYPSGSVEKTASDGYFKYTLAEEDTDFSGLRIRKYRFLKRETSTNSWADMFVEVIRLLHKRKPEVLRQLANTDGGRNSLASKVSTSYTSFRSCGHVDDGIYINTSNNTEKKLQILRDLFKIYRESPYDLVFYIEDEFSGR